MHVYIHEEHGRFYSLNGSIIYLMWQNVDWEEHEQGFSPFDHDITRWWQISRGLDKWLSRLFARPRLTGFDWRWCQLTQECTSFHQSLRPKGASKHFTLRFQCFFFN